MRRFAGPGRITKVAFLSTALAACGGSGGGEGGNGSPPARPAERRAVVLTTDFVSSSLATLSAEDPSAADALDARLHGDAVARVDGAIVYVLNRFGADNVQALDARNGFRTLWQCSVGNGGNPHDIAVLSEEKAYVSLYGGGIAVVNPRPRADCSDFVRGTIDLSTLADADGFAEPDRLALVDGRLYVTIQRLIDFEPSASSYLAIVDTATDQLSGSILLSSPNPFAETKGIPREPEGGKLLIAEVGAFGVPDGGIERVDPATGVAEGHFVTEAELGGDINDFVIVSRTRGYVIVSDADFNNRLVRFDPSDGKVEATLLSGSAFLPDVEYDPATDLLWVASQDFSRPGIRIFAADDSEVTSAAIDTGLSPFVINFVE